MYFDQNTAKSVWQCPFKGNYVKANTVWFRKRNLMILSPKFTNCFLFSKNPRWPYFLLKTIFLSFCKQKAFKIFEVSKVWGDILPKQNSSFWCNSYEFLRGLWPAEQMFPAICQRCRFHSGNNYEQPQHLFVILLCRNIANNLKN